ncbi:MAG TPA: phenylalanine--tRNA ligase subunit beta [Thermoanaerobaculia bacterium]|nr:phenylalanine--tRNA ligase subunit beta [Thermoanaerobaculia bacterium]
MRISRDWLSDFIDLGGISDHELEETLTSIGHAIESVEKLGEDSVFEVEFTANRIDAMSHLGLARELGAATGREVRTDAPPAPSGDAGVSVRIDAPLLCSRYSALMIRGVKVEASSSKFRQRLEAVGQRPINNVVDATNYVMLALGHPLHAFDLRDIRGNQIIVRAGGPGEKLSTLDGFERVLDPEIPVIADGERGIAIGGIMGGANSEIRSDTSDVLLECAHFDPASIRKAARRLGMKTDASYRFERGVDPNDTVAAITACARLIAEEAGGEIGKLVDVVARPIESQRIMLRGSRLDEMSAGRIDLPFARKIFQSLGMDVREVAAGLEVVIPTWRGDLTEETDLIEEALRFFGYDNIPASLPRVTTGDTIHSPVAELEDALRDVLHAAGLTETISYGFIHPDHNAIFTDEAPLEVTNALTENISSMRLTLAPGLLTSVAFNRSYGNRDGSLFEIGRTYHRQSDGVVEVARLGIVLFGQTGSQWGEQKRQRDFFDLKGIIESISGSFHAGITFRAGTRPWLRSGAAAEVLAGDRIIGLAGALDRSVLEPFELKGEVWFAEIELEPLAGASSSWQMSPVSRHPGVPMVLAVMHRPDLSYQSMVETIRAMNIPHLEQIGLWDRFVPPGGDEIKTALGMWYQAHDRSLTQEEVSEMHAEVSRRLGESLPVRVL